MEQSVAMTQDNLAKLAAKLVNVMRAVGYVQKTGKNQAQHYTYVTEADLADKFRAALIAQGLAMIPSLKSRSDREITSKSGSQGTLTSVVMSYTLIDADTGATIAFDSAGDGIDYGDKAVYKAITGAKKYAMKELSVVSTGDDPEKDDVVQSKKEPGKNEPAAERVAAMLNANAGGEIDTGTTVKSSLEGSLLPPAPNDASTVVPVGHERWSGSIHVWEGSFGSLDAPIGKGPHKLKCFNSQEEKTFDTWGEPTCLKGLDLQLLVGHPVCVDYSIRLNTYKGKTYQNAALEHLELLSPTDEKAI